MFKLILVVLLLASPVLAQDPTATSLLAAGCGPDETKFDVKIDKKAHPTGQPEAARALVYVFADQASDNAKLVVGPVITRIGADGNWVGALKLKSYFYVPMSPGDHRLCASVQSKLESRTIRYSAATTFTAEAGKTYYFRTKTPYHPQPQDYVQLVPVDPAEAQLRIGAAALSTSELKK
jgi:hypothetical protein